MWWMLMAAAFGAPDALGRGDGHDGPLVLDNQSGPAPSYYRLAADAPAGATDLDLTATAGLSVGDVLLVIQMKGATATTGNTSDVLLTGSGAGQFDFHRIGAINGQTVTLDAPLRHAFTAADAQGVLTPQYSTVELRNGGNLTAPAWNGTTGGVVALLASDTVSIDSGGYISVSGVGYRGGNPGPDNSSYDCGALSATSANGGGAGKGGGLTGLYGANQNVSAGRGNLANGAGGGNCHNAGGGGGGNGGPGGRGGNEYGDTDVRGGIGGARVLQDGVTHAAMGGGGGGGQRNNGVVSRGGPGGGLVLLRADSLAIDGASGIWADGANGADGGGDGSGGGGAGGSIFVDLATSLSCAGGGLYARGGNGGSCAGNHGPGGGGGGGVIRVRGVAASCPTFVSNGVAGTDGSTSRGSGPTVPDAPGFTGEGTVGTDHDEDGFVDGTDLDGDNDGVPDVDDACPFGNVGWTSVASPSPAELLGPSLVTWLDAADPEDDGTAPADATTLSAWADRGGLANDWPATGNCGIFRASDDLTGLPAVECTNTGTLTEPTTAVTSTGAFLAAFTYRKLASDSNGRFLDGMTGNWLMGSHDTHHRSIFFTGNPADWNSGVAIPGDSHDWHLFIAYRTSDGLTRLWDENGFVASWSGTNDASTMRWGWNSGALQVQGQTLDGRMGAWIRADQDGITDAQIARLSAYLLTTIGPGPGAVTDLDGDGCQDGAEDDDDDGDGLLDADEAQAGGDPRSADSDGDGVCDGNASPWPGSCTPGPDVCPGFDDAIDLDNNGTPDGCDNTPPVVITNNPLLVTEGGTATVTTEVVVTDAEQTPAEIELFPISPPLHGALLLDGVPALTSITQADIDAGRVGYAHDGSEQGSDSIPFDVSDGRASVALTLDISVFPVNDPPVLLTNAGLVLPEGDEQVIDEPLLHASDADHPDTAVWFRVTLLPRQGTLLLDGTAVVRFDEISQDAVTAGRLSYLHDGSENHADNFRFVLNDGVVALPEEVFDLQATPVNDPPTAVDDRFSTPPSQPLDVPARDGVLANDADPDTPRLTATLVQDVARGTLSLDPDGGFRYAPEAGFEGTARFTYAVDDGIGSDQAEVEIRIAWFDTDTGLAPESSRTPEGEPDSIDKVPAGCGCASDARVSWAWLTLVLAARRR